MKPMIFHNFATCKTKYLHPYYARRGVTVVVSNITNDYVTMAVAECSLKDQFSRKKGVATALENGFFCVPTTKLYTFLSCLDGVESGFVERVAISVLSRPRG